MGILLLNMIRIFSIVLLIGLLSLAFSSVAVVQWHTDTEHDFGDIPQGQAATHYFEFTNISADTMLIDNVRTTCGCTAPDWTYDPILPDSSSTIKVVFDAKKEGYFYKKITVFFSNQRKAEKLYIGGYVEE